VVGTGQQSSCPVYRSAHKWKCLAKGNRAWKEVVQIKKSQVGPKRSFGFLWFIHTITMDATLPDDHFHGVWIWNSERAGNRKQHHQDSSHFCLKWEYLWCRDISTFTLATSSVVTEPENQQCVTLKSYKPGSRSDKRPGLQTHFLEAQQRKDPCACPGCFLRAQEERTNEVTSKFAPRFSDSWKFYEAWFYHSSLPALPLKGTLVA
jgi:hypothetical protein